MYNLTFGQNIILVKITNQKNYVFFMPHAFSQNNILLVNVNTLVKWFEKPWFVIMIIYHFC